MKERKTATTTLRFNNGECDTVRAFEALCLSRGWTYKAQPSLKRGLLILMEREVKS